MMNATTQQRILRRLDLSDAEQIVEFERLFYAGFERANHNRLVRQLWEWDHADGRLRTRIPYVEQQIWGMQSEEGMLTGGVAVNVALRTLQAAAYGFSLAPVLAAAGERGQICEFLALFSVHEPSFSRMSALWKELFDDLRGEGFTHAVATTSPKILPMYRWAGATCLGEVQIGEEKRIFLLFDLLRTQRKIS